MHPPATGANAKHNIHPRGYAKGMSRSGYGAVSTRGQDLSLECGGANRAQSEDGRKLTYRDARC